MEQIELLAAVEDRLAVAQARAAAQIAVVRILSEGGYDAAEAERLLRGYMSTLADLRRQRWALQAEQGNP